MIRLQNIWMGYEKTQHVLSGVSLDLQPGSFHFLTGASGAGKTTLLQVLSLAMRPSRGEIYMFGKEISRVRREALPKLRRKIGMVSQDFRLLEHLTVAENIALPLKIAGEEEIVIAHKVQEMLSWIGMAEYGNTMPQRLSGGQRQRIAIARAVMCKPDLILADEPTGNLDSQMSLRIIYLFEALNQMGTTVVIATHDEHLISMFNYPVIALEEGRITARALQAA